VFFLKINNQRNSMNTEILTQSFDQFATKTTPTDLALYAGIGLILWILFKDKLSPVALFVKNTYEKLIADRAAPQTLGSSIVNVIKTDTKNVVSTDNTFFELVSSWKKTRDLAVKSGCDKAVKVADDMFPFLSPNSCQKEDAKDKVV